MAHSNSPLGQWTAIVPAGSDAPAIVSDLTLLITAAEAQSVMRYTTRAARDAAITAPVNGELTVITGTVNEVDLRLGGAWVKIYPIQYTGAGAPSSGLGIVGDFYIQTS